MLFMKGAGDKPFCKFSKQIVEILNKEGIAFDSFDIFGDEEVRQGLKEYSDYPTYPQLYHNGKLIGGVDIVRELAEEGELEELKAAAISGAGSLEDRLKALINQHRVMLFMKGNRNEPRCGFSAKTIEILNKVGADYQTFDILGDEEVRQGLKTFSDWPTYPQLYVDGTLLGGIDIIQSLYDEDELEDSL